VIRVAISTFRASSTDRTLRRQCPRRNGPSRDFGGQSRDSQTRAAVEDLDRALVRYEQHGPLYLRSLKPGIRSLKPSH
jgi:hypothetical protein